MKTVELFRHTDNEGDRLSEAGVRAAEEIGARLRPPYDLLVSTGAERANETLRIWRGRLGIDAAIEIEPALRSAVEDRWREAYRAAGSGELEAMRRVDPDLVEKESTLLGAALRGIFERLPEGGRALVVGHSPTNEAAVLGLTGAAVAPLGKGQGVRIVHERGRFAVEGVIVSA